MLMPETTMNEDDLFQARKNDVRMSRQALTVETIAITEGVQKTPDLEFRAHVFAPNAPHVIAAALL